MRYSAEHVRVSATLGVLAALLAAVVGLGSGVGRTDQGMVVSREVNRALVEELRLTDLALWSEASYCRHPTQADGFAAWADHPAAMERFPAGSLVPPPQSARIERKRSGGEP